MRSWEPRRMRRTVGPLPGCAVITSTPLSTRFGDLRRPARGLYPRTCNLTVSSARAFGFAFSLAFARYTGDDSACAASARLLCQRPRVSDTDGKPMTAHRAALPVTTDVTGVSRVGFRTAGTPQGVRPVSHLLPSQPQASPHPAGNARPLPQPTATCLLGPRPESVKTGRDFTRVTLA